MNSAVQAEQAGTSPDLIGLLPAILWQRRKIIALTTGLGLLASVAVAYSLPQKYRSSAQMIVQSSQLPTAVTGEGRGEVIDRRLARIRQQIVSRPDLVALIQKHGLYRSRQSSEPLNDIVEDMRAAIKLEPTTADLPGDASDQRTIAVTLSFDYSEPTKAKAVAQDLTQKLLELYARGNAQQANNTVVFLTDQATALETQIRALEGRISQISAANGGVLANRGVTMMGGNSGSYDVQIAALQRDNATLLAQREASKSADTRDPLVTAAEAQLSAARARYTDNHPDVVLARLRLDEARQLARANTQRQPTNSIDNQIAFNNSQISALRAAKGQDEARVSASISAQSRAPVVEQQISQLQAQLTGLTQQYQAVSDRLLAARAGVKAEDRQMAERLQVSEPPVVPSSPESPSRKKVVALGAAAGLGLGLAIAFLLELILRPVRSPAALAAVTGVQPLGIVPVIRSIEETRRRSGAKGQRGLMSNIGILLSDILGLSRRKSG